MHRNPPITETILAITVVGINGFICVIVSVWGGRCLAELYGNDLIFEVTKLGISAHLWSPVVLCVALALYFAAKIRQRNTALAFWILAVFSCCVSALVTYAINRPFATTTFRMGTQVPAPHLTYDNPPLPPFPLHQPPGKLYGADNVAQELTELETLAFHRHQTRATLEKLRVMWLERDPLRRPLIAYLMCQLGDRSVVPDVADAFFAGEYYTGRSIEPDGCAAGTNAARDSLRTLILYGTPHDHLKLMEFLSVPRARDPIFKAGELCHVLLDLSTNREGRGLPPGYPAQEFPLDLVIRCLDYTEEVEMNLDAGDGKWTSLRGCDLAAQTVQNVKGKYFGHDKYGSLQERDSAIEKIRRWWATSNSHTRIK